MWEILELLNVVHRVNLRLASGNLPWVDVLPAVGANVYSILHRDYLLLSRDAVAALTERSSRFIHRKPERLRSAAAEAAARL
jgi:ribosomal protein L4